MRKVRVTRESVSKAVYESIWAIFNIASEYN